MTRSQTKKTKRFTFRLTEKSFRKFRAYAKLNGQTLSEVIHNYLDRVTENER